MSNQKRYIPEGFHSLTPYLVCNEAARLLEFLKQAFGAEETFRMNRKDGTIAHASARIADSMLEMADPAEEWKAMPAGLHLYMPNVDEGCKRERAPCTNRKRWTTVTVKEASRILQAIIGTSRRIRPGSISRRKDCAASRRG
jgi:hypothetical protein